MTDFGPNDCLNRPTPYLVLKSDSRGASFSSPKFRDEPKIFRARLRIIGAICVSPAVLLVGINPRLATNPLYYCSRRNTEAFRRPRRFAIKTTVMKHSTFRSSFAITVVLCLACNQKPPATNSPSAAATVNNNTATVSPSADHEAAQPPAPSQPDQRWDGTIQQWGAMRDVLALGKTQARVKLADVVKEPHAYGVGAVAGLMGEVTILKLTSRSSKASSLRPLSCPITKRHCWLLLMFLRGSCSQSKARSTATS